MNGAKRADGLTSFFQDVGLPPGQHSQALYTLPVRPRDADSHRTLTRLPVRNALPQRSNALGWRRSHSDLPEDCALSGAKRHTIEKRDQIGHGRTFSFGACDPPVDDRKPRHGGQAKRDAPSGNCREKPASPTDMAEKEVRAASKQPEREPEHGGHRFPIYPTSANWKNFTAPETARLFRASSSLRKSPGCLEAHRQAPSFFGSDDR